MGSWYRSWYLHGGLQNAGELFSSAWTNAHNVSRIYRRRDLRDHLSIFFYQPI